MVSPTRKLGRSGIEISAVGLGCWAIGGPLWYQTEDKRNEVPRIAEGKYLKLLYHLHEEKGNLDIGRNQLEMLCLNCELGHLCDESTLTVYCLESVLVKKQ